MSKVIVHIDLNAFFFRCEEIKDPSLENKAVAVGHDGRAGIVSTCSYKAREYGVHSAMPMNQAKKFCPQLIIKNDDYRFYMVKSHEFFNFVRSYVKDVEVASCDECYADFTEATKGVTNLTKYFQDFQIKLFQKTKLKCSIGIANTRFLAKMGSDYRKPMGITYIRKQDIPNILYPLPVKDIYGIGKKTAPKIEDLGIKTIGELVNKLESRDEELLKIIGKFDATLLESLRGEGEDKLYLDEWDPKSISASTTLSEDTNNFEVIKDKFEEVVDEVAYRMNKEGKIGATIQIMVKDVEYKAHNHSFTLDTPTDNKQIILNTVLKLYERKYYGLVIRAVGVAVQNLIDRHDMNIQMTLFNYQEHEKESETKLLINDLNRKMKKNLLKRASEAKK